MAVGDLVEREERPAYVRFEVRAIENKVESLKQGIYVADDVIYALVTPPYSKDCFEQEVNKWLENQRINVKNQRIPQKYLDFWTESYEAFKKGQESPLDGTSVKDWSSISPAQVKMLLAAKMYTIEDLAASNDEGLRRLGMGGLDLRNKAKNWLQAASDHGPLTAQVTSLQTENGQLKGTIDSLQGQIAALTQQVGNIAQANLMQQGSEGNITAEDILEEVTTEKSELEILREQYQATFGKPAHHLMRENGLKKKLGLHLRGVEK